MNAIHKIISSYQCPSSRNFQHLTVLHILKKIKKTGATLKLKDLEIQLVLNEAISNAMEHGNNWDINKMVTTSVEKCFKGFCVKIHDDGDGFSYLNLPIKRDNYHLRGRGINIIQYYCECNWNEKGNEITVLFETSAFTP